MKYIKSLLSLTDAHDRKMLLLLGLFMLFAAFIELIGVGSLFPYVKILSDPAIIHTNHTLRSVYNYFSFSSQTSFLLLLGFLIFLMILLKGAVTCFNNYFQAKFGARMNNKIASKILNNYVNMEYSNFTSTNSTTLTKHLLYDVQNVTGVISGILNMLTNIMIGIALIALMLLADPGVVLASIAMLLFFLQLTVRFTKVRMNKLGKSNELNNRKVYKVATETFSGIKDIKIFGVENFFVNKYNVIRRILSSQTVQFNIISNVPVVVMNVVGFGTLMGVLLFLLYTKGNMIQVLPIIAIIAICIQRLLPTISAISTSIGLIRKFKPVVFIVADAVRSLKIPDINITSSGNKNGNLSFNDKIAFKNVCYKYPDSEELALKNLSFEIKKNTTIGIVGVSGAGKSTLIDVMLGLYSHLSGSICCDDIEVNANNRSKFRSLIGYVPQRTFLLDASIKENIAFGISSDDFNNEQLEMAIKISQLKELIDELPDGVNTVIGENGLKLSGGQRQRLGIARALYNDPEVLILDEATNALDSITETEFNRSLGALMNHKTLIIIAHRLSSIDFCDYLLVMDKGEILSEGEYQSVINNKKFKELYPQAHEIFSEV